MSDALAARGLSLESRVGSLGSRAEGLHSQPRSLQVPSLLQSVREASLAGLSTPRQARQLKCTVSCHVSETLCFHGLA